MYNTNGIYNLEADDQSDIMMSLIRQNYDDFLHEMMTGLSECETKENVLNLGKKKIIFLEYIGIDLSHMIN